MPITQATMVELMNESRAAVQNAAELRHGLLQYLESAKARYPANSDLVEVCVAAITIIRMHPQPDDRATYRAEWHYRKYGKNNTKQRLRQEAKRRDAGVMTQEEAMERLTALNALRRGQPTETYEQFNAQAPSRSSGIKYPRDDPDDKPLEFETLEDLPAPRDQNNLLGGLDLPLAPSDNGDANNGGDD